MTIVTIPELGDRLPHLFEVAEETTGGYVLVVKTTQTGKALWVTSYRRLFRQEAERDAEIRRLLKKERK